MGVAAASAQTIREEVAELLGIGPDAVDPDVDLISQGLDSIRMMSLAGRWRRHGVGVSFADLAADPSVRGWSALLASTGGIPQPAAASHAGRADLLAGAPFPLAPMQHALWVGREGDQQLGGVAAHLYVEFDGTAVDPDQLQVAATALAVRHPMLRVEFLPDGTQRIGPPPEAFPVAVQDLRELATEDIEHKLAATRRAKSHQQLGGQVLELTLSLLPGGRTRLHVDLDMQAADAMSYRTLTADLAAVYQGRALPELGYTYREYRQAASVRSAAAEADHEWWSQRVPELPDAPRLPLVPTAERADPHRTTRRWRWLDPQTRDALFAAARCRGVTPAMTLAASFSEVLAGWSAEPRFLLNVPLFGREQLHADVDRLVGDFTSSLLLDVDLGQARNATDRAHALQRTFHAAAAHASYAGLSVLRDLGRHRGTQVLAPVVFTSALGLGELFPADVTTTFGTPVWINSQGPQVLLDAQVTEFDGGVLVNWDVREDAFRPGVIDAMFDRHIAELRRLAESEAAWDAPPAPLVGQPQRAVRDAVNSKTAEPSGNSLHQGFFASAASRPDAPALISSAGNLTYAELRKRVLAVGAALEVAGVKPGDAVAILGPKCAEQVTAMLGILAAGAVYVPVGADQPAERAAGVLEAGGVRMAVVCGDDAPATALPYLTVAEAVRVGGRATEFASAATDPAELAYVLFTSGSTGEPKGVEVTHDAAMNSIEFLNGHFGIGPDDRCLALSTLECDMSVLDVFGTLTAGGAVVVVDEEHRRDPDQWARLIDAHGVTVLNFLPGWLEMLLDVGAERLQSVRVVPTGGDWVGPDIARRLRAQAPNVRFAGLGGATETAVHATICEVDDPPERWTAVPYGTPFTNNACRVVNSAGADCPDWVPGELWIAGRGIARGYRGRPDLTAERFVNYAGRMWYRTGDLARYWPDGTLEFVGRADHRIKVSGYRIELGDVEAALQRVPGLHAAVASVVQADGGNDVLAAMVRADNPGLTEAHIRTTVAEFVPPHMVPRHVVLVDQIPFTVGGKIDRRVIARQLAEAVTGGAIAGPHRDPSTALESALGAIVAGLLGVERVGIDDDFFKLGGDSVLATTVVARIREWLDTPSVMVADIFATRTIAGLADRLCRREFDPDRLERVAELYLEVTHMDSDAVLAATAGQNRSA